MNSAALTKKCTKCNVPKDVEEFYFRDKAAGLRRTVCKECTSQEHRQYYIENRGSIIKNSSQWYKSNRESVLKTRELWRKNNKEKIFHINSQYRKNNKEKIVECNKVYYQTNNEQIKSIVRLYRENNKSYINARNREYYIKNKYCIKKYQKEYRKNNRKSINEYIRNRRTKDVVFKLRHYISTGIRASLKSNKAGRNWENIIGYTVMDLKAHLEKQFSHNMSWTNYGKWHIDHCRPISWFDNTEEGVLKAWELSNLQPMWAHENLVKGNRWSSPRKVKTTK